MQQINIKNILIILVVGLILNNLFDDSKVKPPKTVDQIVTEYRHKAHEMQEERAREPSDWQETCEFKADPEELRQEEYHYKQIAKLSRSNDPLRETKIDEIKDNMRLDAGGLERGREELIEKCKRDRRSR